MHILHLEDEKALVEVLSLGLHMVEPKIQITSFANGEEAYLYIMKNAETIDLYVLDVRVQGSMSGLNVAQRIRDLKSNAPIIVTTAFPIPRTPDIQNLQYTWVGKPWKLQDFSAYILMRAREYIATREGSSDTP